MTCFEKGGNLLCVFGVLCPLVLLLFSIVVMCIVHVVYEEVRQPAMKAFLQQ